MGRLMEARDTFFVRFWGVRGSIACPGPNTLRYGGNTSCLEIQCGDRMLIFDAGTGLRGLGEELLSRGPVDADLFLTHTHFDHVCGLPFFVPLFIPGNKIRLAAGHLQPEKSLKQVVVDMMMAPLFPVPPGIFQAEVAYRDFAAGDLQEPGPGIRILTAPLNHPNNATGYRIEFSGKSITYVTDTEHGEDGLDQTIVELVKGADLFIYDCTYTDEEYQRFKGFGHSTWQEGVRLADEAGVKTLVIFHHDPSHDDEMMDKIGGDAENARPGTLVAREGMTLMP
ncbi:MBL fold metallo-hydrolase [Alphaproteobacteria bacterium]|jgi:phosphoribosyl 1,2-cyclic phosphodiesterase|nr:MBL fold metallo-hydrolase [Alphaproteobacteria bacterium]